MWDILSHEQLLIETVLQFLRNRDLLACSLVNRAWNTMAVRFMERPFQFGMIPLGDRGVGVHTLMNRLYKGAKFFHSDMFNKAKVNARRGCAWISVHYYGPLNPHALLGSKYSEVALFIFDVSNKQSLQNVDSWLKKYLAERMNSSSSHCLVLVPNKADLPRDQWQVHTEQAFKFSEERNMYLYGEISALKDDDVTVMQLFEWIAFIQAEKYCSWQAMSLLILADVRDWALEIKMSNISSHPATLRLEFLRT